MKKHFGQNIINGLKQNFHVYAHTYITQMSVKKFSDAIPFEYN